MKSAPLVCGVLTLLASVLVAALLTAAGPVVVSPADGRLDFARDVAPILSANCYRCRGFDAHERKSGLRLDQRDGATRPADSGSAAIVPRKPASRPYHQNAVVCPTIRGDFRQATRGAVPGSRATGSRTRSRPAASGLSWMNFSPIDPAPINTDDRFRNIPLRAKVLDGSLAAWHSSIIIHNHESAYRNLVI